MVCHGLVGQYMERTLSDPLVILFVAERYSAAGRSAAGMEPAVEEGSVERLLRRVQRVVSVLVEVDRIGCLVSGICSIPRLADRQIALPVSCSADGS